MLHRSGPVSQVVTRLVGKIDVLLLADTSPSLLI